MAREAMGWKMDTSILGLMLLTSVGVGLSNLKSNAAGVPADEQARALVEVVVIGSAAAYYSRSWWPLVGPLGYLAFDKVWSERRGYAPLIGADAPPEAYADGNV